MLNNILFFEPTSGFGGSAQCLNILLGYLDKNRFRPIVVIANQGPVFKQISDTGIEVIDIKSSNIKDVKWLIKTVHFITQLFGIKAEKAKSYILYALNFFYSIIPTAIKLYILLKKKNVQLLHINTYIDLSGILAAKLAGIPCICHIRGIFKPLRTERIFAKWADALIVLTNQGVTFYKDYFPQDKIKVIHDSVDLKKFINPNGDNIRKELKLNKRNPIVGIVGRLVEGKGFDIFIKAAAIILQKKKDVKFLIVGNDPTGNKKIEQSLKKLTANLNLNGNIIFTGWRNDVYQVMSIFDILVQAATSAEGFGMTCVEAMALQKPVVATNILEQSEAVLDNQTGLIVPPDNPKALADVILKLINNPVMARRIGRAGAQRVNELFNITNNIKQLEEVYKKLMVNNNA